jgi:hypothetical protein
VLRGALILPVSLLILSTDFYVPQLQASGVAVPDEVYENFNAIKTGKAHRYAIYKLAADMTHVTVSATGDRSKTYADMLGQLSEVCVRCSFRALEWFDGINLSRSS